MSTPYESKSVYIPRDFLAERSLNPDVGASVYINFHLTDKDFVEQLYNALITLKRNVVCYWQFVPESQEWLSKNQESINICDAFIYVLSPTSMEDKQCNLHLDHALKMGKRIIPIECRSCEYRKARKELQSLNWIFFREDGSEKENQASVRRSMAALDNSILHLKRHTALLLHALEWEELDYEKAHLLQGNDLKLGIEWERDSALGYEPKPTKMHMSYIQNSRDLAASIKKRTALASALIAIAIIGIIWPGWGLFVLALIFTHAFVYMASY